MSGLPSYKLEFQTILDASLGFFRNRSKKVKPLFKGKKIKTLLTNLPSAVSFEHWKFYVVMSVMKSCVMALVVSLLLNVDHFKAWLLTNLML